MHWPVAFEHTNETLTPIDPVTKRFRIADVPVSEGKKKKKRQNWQLVTPNMWLKYS